MSLGGRLLACVGGEASALNSIRGLTLRFSRGVGESLFAQQSARLFRRGVEEWDSGGRLVVFCLCVICTSLQGRAAGFKSADGERTSTTATLRCLDTPPRTGISRARRGGWGDAQRGWSSWFL